jgi:hypothetical protein
MVLKLQPIQFHSQQTQQKAWGSSINLFILTQERGKQTLERERETERQRETDRETERQTEREKMGVGGKREKKGRQEEKHLKCRCSSEN